MKSEEIINYLITLIEEYKKCIINKEIVYERLETLVSDNRLEYSENQNLKYILETFLPDVCLFNIDEPGEAREKEKCFYQAMCECEELLKQEES